MVLVARWCRNTNGSDPGGVSMTVDNQAVIDDLRRQVSDLERQVRDLSIERTCRMEALDALVAEWWRG